MPLGHRRETVHEPGGAVGEADDLLGADRVGKGRQAVHPLVAGKQDDPLPVGQPGPGAGLRRGVADQDDRRVGISGPGVFRAGLDVEVEGDPGGEVEHVVEQVEVVGDEQRSMSGHGVLHGVDGLVDCAHHGPDTAPRGSTVNPFLWITRRLWITSAPTVDLLCQSRTNRAQGSVGLAGRTSEIPNSQSGMSKRSKRKDS